MSKQIQVPDSLHARLKQDAEANFRTIPGQIEWLMSNATPEKVETTPVYKNVKFNPDGTVEKADPTIPEFEYHTDAPIEEVLGVPKKSEATPRTRSNVLADIRFIERERDDRLMYCQDEDTRREINDEYQPALDSLWSEYKGLKGE